MHGPPRVPSASIVPLIDMIRLGFVGPNTEEKYPSQIVKASASA